MSVLHQRRLAATLWLLPGAFLALEVALLLLLLITVSGAVDLQSAPTAVSHPELAHPYRGDRPVQAAAVLEANAARLGWEGVDLRAAGDAWFRAGDRRAALAFWQAAAAAGVDDPRLYRQLAAVYLESRRWDEADRALSRLIDAPSGTSGDRAWAYFQRGLVRSCKALIRKSSRLSSTQGKMETARHICEAPPIGLILSPPPTAGKSTRLAAMPSLLQACSAAA